MTISTLYESIFQLVRFLDVDIDWAKSYLEEQTDCPIFLSDGATFVAILIKDADFRAQFTSKKLKELLLRGPLGFPRVIQAYPDLVAKVDSSYYWHKQTVPIWEKRGYEMLDLKRQTLDRLIREVGNIYRSPPDSPISP